MEFELGPVVLPLLPLHQKTAQFFEAALAECFVAAMPVKRMIGVLVANGESRGTRVRGDRKALQRRTRKTGERGAVPEELA
jgi:hypothetical protein